MSKQREGEVEDHISIHDRVVAKEHGLERYLVVDPHPRRSFVTSFGDLSSPELLMRVPADGSTVSWPGWRDYSVPADVKAVANGVQGRLQDWFGMEKTITGTDSGLAFGVRSLQLPPNLSADDRLWVEFNFTLLTDSADDRWLSVDGAHYRPDMAIALDQASETALHDGWQGISLRLTSARPCRLMSYPVYTVSNSEGGFERTYQGTCIMLGYSTSELTRGIGISLRLGSTDGPR
jgi:hypothetical protein